MTNGEIINSIFERLKFPGCPHKDTTCGVCMDQSRCLQMYCHDEGLATAIRDMLQDAINCTRSHGQLLSKMAQIRAARGMTQEQLAAAINAKRSAIAMYETLRSLPPLPVANAIARALSSTINECFADRM